MPQTQLSQPRQSERGRQSGSPATGDGPCTDPAQTLVNSFSWSSGSFVSAPSLPGTHHRHPRQQPWRNGWREAVAHCSSGQGMPQDQGRHRTCRSPQATTTVPFTSPICEGLSFDEASFHPGPAAPATEEGKRCSHSGNAPSTPGSAGVAATSATRTLRSPATSIASTSLHRGHSNSNSSASHTSSNHMGNYNSNNRSTNASLPRRKARETEVSFPEFPATTTTNASPRTAASLAGRGAGVGPLSVETSGSVSFTANDSSSIHSSSSHTNKSEDTGGGGGGGGVDNSRANAKPAAAAPSDSSHAGCCDGGGGGGGDGDGVLPLPHVLAGHSGIEVPSNSLPYTNTHVTTTTTTSNSNNTASHHSGGGPSSRPSGNTAQHHGGQSSTATNPETICAATSNTGSGAYSGMYPADSSLTSLGSTTSKDEMNYLFGSCHIPLNVVVMVNILITVALVAVVSILPLSTVSIRSMEHVTSKLSASLAKTLAESINANMYFLPLAVKSFASMWLVDRLTQSWNWTRDDMPRAMQQMCEVASFSRSSSHLLYLSMSSPYSGFDAYCSPQFSNDFLVGRHIVANTSDHRYIIDNETFLYTQPPQVYRAVQPMNSWEATVGFGGDSNPWHRVALPWYEKYLDDLKAARRQPATDPSGAAAVAARSPHADPPSALGSIAHLRDEQETSLESTAAYRDTTARASRLLVGDSTESGWSVFTHDDVSIVTYTIPFIDYTGNLSIITGALQPSGIVSVFPEGILSADIGSAMVVDPETGLVMLNSWGEDTRVFFDNWNLDDPEGLRLSRLEGLYLDKIDHPFMKAAVGQLGGLAGLANKPLEVTRWQVKFHFHGDDALVLATRITDQTGELNLIVIYAVARGEYTASIDTVRIIVIVSVVVVLVIIAIVDLALVYLFLQPLRDVAAGLHDASKLKDGSSAVEGRISIIREVADMQYHFKVMNEQLMCMKAFLPQGVLHPMSAWSGSDRHTEAPFDGSFGDESLAERANQAATNNDDEDDSGDGEGPVALPVGDAAEGRHGTMHLNDRVLHDEVNKFRRRYCSVITFFMHVREADTAVSVIDNLVDSFMRGAVPSVLRHGGVIEVHRPEIVMVSFGAHSRVSMHQTRAAMCALETMEVLNRIAAIGPRVGCLVDAGEFYVGTCGAEQRFARVTFGARTPVGNDLIKLSKSLDCQILVTQRFAAALDEHLVALPVDSIMFPLSNKYTILYELRGSTKALSSRAAESEVRAMVHQVKLAFHKMLRGDYTGALSYLEPYEKEDRQVARLAGTCRALVARGVAKPFVRTVGRIKLTEADTRYDIGNEADDNFTSAGHKYSFSSNNNNAGNSLNGVASNNDSNWAAMRSSTFLRMSPYNSPGLDSTLHLLSHSTPTTMRIIEGCHVHRDSDNISTTAAGAGRNSPVLEGLADLAATNAAQLTPDVGTDSLVGPRTSTPPLHPHSTGTDHNAVGEDGALFEMFLSEDDDDDDGGYGTGAGTLVSASGGPRAHSDGARSGEPPVQFVDYEGNHWTRSADRLAHGAFAVVYRGLSQSGNLVALKCFQLRARNVDVHAITEEVSVFANLHHENIVQYVGIYVSDFYIIEIMEFVPGGSLDTLLTNFGSLSKNAVRRYLRDILRGLGYLHSMNIVHCDIKPHNVLLAMDGQCKLSDFGSAIARATTSVCKIDDVLEMRGTPGYMAPEVARGEVPTVKSDVFSLGVAVLELLTGKLPWQYIQPPPPPPPRASAPFVVAAQADGESAGHALVSDYAELQTPITGGDGDSKKAFSQPTAGTAASAPAMPLEQVLKNAVNMIRSIGRGVLHPAIPATLDDDVRDFIQSCIHAEPAQRATVDELLNHPWLM